MTHPKFETPDLTQENISAILALFPDCLTEVKDENGKIKRAINFDTLRQHLQDDIVEGQEHYEFTWPGKRAAVLEAAQSIRSTLRPCPEESVNWDTTQNLYIEGDNLDVLKLLRNGYMGKVKMIYIDPPYNTGSDSFVYPDDYSISSEEYEKRAGYRDENGNWIFTNTNTNGRFHSDWCSMIYSRLIVAKVLLANEGLIIISIDDREVANMRNICSEVFGPDNFIAEFPRVTKRGGKSTDTFAKNHDYILVYCKNTDAVQVSGIEHIDSGFKYQDEFFDKRGPYKLNQTLDYNTLQYSETMDYPIEIEGTIFVPGSSIEKHNLRHSGIHGSHDWVWRWSRAMFDFGYKNGWIVISKTGRIYTKTYLNATIKKNSSGEYYIEYKDRTKAISTIETTENKYSNDNATKEFKALMGASYFDYVKPTSLIDLFLRTCSEDDSIIMDFFSGSATTAHAVMQLNAEDGGHRRFIMVQYPEECAETSEAYKAGYRNICEIGKERIRRAGKKIKEDAGLAAASDLDVGFRVLKVDSSNMKDVYFAADEYSQGLLTDTESNIKEDRTDIDLLFGCLIDWGLPMSMPYTSEKIGDCTVHIYNGGDLIACFDDNIPDDVIKEIAKKQPMRAVFRDSSFRNSPSKINVGEIFKLLAPNTSVKVI